MDDVELKKYPLAQPLIWRVDELKTIWKKRKLNRIIPGYDLTEIMPYHTPIAWVEKGSRAKWRYGVEYEIELNRLEDPHTGTEWEWGHVLLGCVARAYCDVHFRKYAGGVTRDRSLDRGFELVLPPLTIPKVVESCMGLVNDPYIRAAIKEENEAGFHVTVDPFETAKQQRAFHDFWNNDNLYYDFTSTIRRGERKYCKQRTTVSRTRGGWMKPDTRKTHYNRCNVRENGAMEVRVFQAVYEEHLLHRQLVLVDAVNRAVRRGMTEYDDIKWYANERLGRLNERNI